VKVMYERVAGIDVHKDMIKVAVRSPGDKPWTRKTEILTFRTFYGVLRAMARELRRRGVTHVVMEASGVYTEPVYYALCEEDFTEVAVVNPAHAKALKGHKTDLLTELPPVSAAQQVLPSLWRSSGCPENADCQAAAAMSLA
jgi:transposase